MFWKIEFDGERQGQGWLKFNENMESIGIYTLTGELITENVEYHPIEFDTTPEWA